MKKDKKPSYVNIGILTIITTISWVFFSAYRVLTAEPTPDIPSEVLTPFSPELDIAKIDEIQGRIFFEEGQVQTNLILPGSPEPEPSPTPTEEPLEESEEATESGEETVEGGVE